MKIFAAVGGLPSAVVFSQEVSMPQGTIVVETITSGVLKNNPLGDPHVRRVPVYLPPGYDASSERYPTVYHLTGFTGRGTMYLNDAPFDETLPQRLDRLITSSAIRPMIVVMPDCFTRLGGSQYLNSSATGRYEDHLVQELVPHIDGKFRTRADAQQRAVVGKSSGGYGSVILAMRHPDVFRLMCCHSGDLYFELCYKPDIIKYLRNIKEYGGLTKFLADLPNIPRRAFNEFGAVLNTIAMSACYSPNPNAQHGFDLPFDEETGEIREDVWARWLEWDPVHLVDKHLDALRQLKLVWLDCGTRDEFNLHFGARIFCKRLRARGIPYIYEEFDDGHMNVQYRFDRSFQAISAALR
jgi:enterochelin esterase family protein